MPFKRNERTYRHAQSLQFSGASQIREINDKASGNDVRAEFAQELHRAFGRAAGGDEIVDENDAFVRGHGVLVHLHFVEPILKRISDRHLDVRKLALFPDGDEAGRELMRDGASKYETARLDAGDLVDLGARPGLHEFVDRAAKRPRVTKKRGDVAEQDSGLRIVRDGADRGGKVVHGKAIPCTRPAIVSSVLQASWFARAIPPSPAGTGASPRGRRSTQARLSIPPTSPLGSETAPTRASA